MSDSPPTPGTDSVRIELDPDALHESREEPFIECPACGAPATFSEIIVGGRCRGCLQADDTEVGTEAADRRRACAANLKLDPRLDQVIARPVIRIGPVPPRCGRVRVGDPPTG